jgi:hypothetical protein
MPNWCSNNLSMSGPPDQVRAILDAVRPSDGADDEKLRLTKFMPQPVDEAGELIDGVSWQYDAWGTKWGDCDTEITSEEYTSNLGSGSLMYNTAWGPASGLMKEISRLHPNVTMDIEYEEPGMNFLGVEQYLNGELVHEQHHEYNFNDGFIKLEDGYKVDFDTDWDDENQDPAGTVNDAVYAALEHMWNHYGLRNAPVNETVIQ